jgi:phosphatidylglycerophosphate synthase
MLPESNWKTISCVAAGGKSENVHHADAMPDPSSRRPLKSRSIPVFQKLAASLARAKVSADTISATGMGFGLASGFTLAATWYVGGAAEIVLWLASAALVQLRLLSNMLDGMVAVEGGQKSKLGPLWNEIPDRISDSATLIGAGYAVGGIPELGWFAALLAVLTAYIRAIGAVNGAGEAFLGVFSKPRRMFAVTVACLVSAVGFASFAMPLVLWLLVLGSAATCVQRLVWIRDRL